MVAWIEGEKVSGTCRLCYPRPLDPPMASPRQVRESPARSLHATDTRSQRKAMEEDLDIDCERHVVIERVLRVGRALRGGRCVASRSLSAWARPARPSAAPPNALPFIFLEPRPQVQSATHPPNRLLPRHRGVAPRVPQTLRAGAQDRGGDITRRGGPRYQEMLGGRRGRGRGRCRGTVLPPLH